MLPAGQKLFCSTAIVLGVHTVQAVMIAIKVSTYICHQHCIKVFSYTMRCVQIQVMKLSFFSINLCHFSLWTNAALDCSLIWAHGLSLYLQGQNLATISKQTYKGETQIYTILKPYIYILIIVIITLQLNQLSLYPQVILWGLSELVVRSGLEIVQRRDFPHWDLSCYITCCCRGTWEWIRCPNVGVLWHFWCSAAFETWPYCWNLGCRRSVPITTGTAECPSANRCLSATWTAPFYIEIMIFIQEMG